jgi:hypothetical protein
MDEGAVRNLMQAAVKVLGSSPLFVRCLAIMVVAAGVSGGPAHSEPAPSPSTEAPPVAIGGWRYEKGGSDVHMFHCQAAACAPGSRVSYRFYAPGTAMTLDQYRREQETVVEALQKRAPPGTQITIVGIEGDEGTNLPRMYRSQRLVVAPDGSQEHVHSGLMLGEKASASLISSSRDEKAAKQNFAMYLLAVALFIQGQRDTKQ